MAYKNTINSHVKMVYFYVVITSKVTIYATWKNILKINGVPSKRWYLCGAPEAKDQNSDSLGRVSNNVRIDPMSQNFDFLVFDGYKNRPFPRGSW